MISDLEGGPTSARTSREGRYHFDVTQKERTLVKKALGVMEGRRGEEKEKNTSGKGHYNPRVVFIHTGIVIEEKGKGPADTKRKEIRK